MTIHFDHGEYLSRDCRHCGKRIEGGKNAVKGRDFVERWRGPVCHEVHPECDEEIKAAEKVAEEIES